MKIENAAGYPYAGQRSQSKATNRSTATSFAAELATSLANRAGPDNSSISAAARHAFSASTAVPSASNFSTSVDAKLAEIRARGPVNRSQEDGDYLLANDKRLAEIRAQGKSSDQLTADELDYMQKAGGFVNTMATLSPAERAIYDKAVASGNHEAVAGLSLIALTRAAGHMAGGANGSTYDPINMEITAANVEKYFRHSIVDQSGSASANFQALISFLRGNASSV